MVHIPDHLNSIRSISMHSHFQTLGVGLQNITVLIWWFLYNQAMQQDVKWVSLYCVFIGGISHADAHTLQHMSVHLNPVMRTASVSQYYVSP